MESPEVRRADKSETASAHLERLQLRKTWSVDPGDFSYLGSAGERAGGLEGWGRAQTWGYCLAEVVWGQQDVMRFPMYPSTEVDRGCSGAGGAGAVRGQFVHME